MAWIESHTVLIRHRKLLQLATALSLRPVEILGHLHAFWHTVLEQQEDGNLIDWPDQMIADAAHYKGDPAQFVAELRLKKWLDGHLVHDWLDHVGRYLTNKYRTANPKKLKQIYKLHKVGLKSDLNQSKVGLKSDRLPTLPDLPNQTLKDLKQDEPSAALEKKNWIERIKALKKEFADRFQTDPDPWFFKQVKSLDRGNPPAEVCIILFERVLNSKAADPYPYALETQLLKIVWETWNGEQSATESNRMKMTPVGKILKQVMSE